MVVSFGSWSTPTYEKWWFLGTNLWKMVAKDFQGCIPANGPITRHPTQPNSVISHWLSNDERVDFERWTASACEPNEANIRKNQTKNQTKTSWNVGCRLGGGTTHCEKKYSLRLGSFSPSSSDSTWKIPENTTWTSAGKRQAKILSPWKPSTPSSNHGKTQWEQKRSKSISISASEAPTLSMFS